MLTRPCFGRQLIEFLSSELEGSHLPQSSGALGQLQQPQQLSLSPVTLGFRQLERVPFHTDQKFENAIGVLPKQCEILLHNTSLERRYLGDISQSLPQVGWYLPQTRSSYTPVPCERRYTVKEFLGDRRDGANFHVLRTGDSVKISHRFCQKGSNWSFQKNLPNNPKICHLKVEGGTDIFENGDCNLQEQPTEVSVLFPSDQEWHPASSFLEFQMHLPKDLSVCPLFSQLSSIERKDK
mmetsp:Transcript_4697/g.6044  ORF Transcript_4697/g.6044 Transcript_4697/m.6044 type:complete len:238 (+) Transcript_4697:1398-2111(+)